MPKMATLFTYHKLIGISLLSNGTQYVNICRWGESEFDVLFSFKALRECVPAAKCFLLQ